MKEELKHTKAVEALLASGKRKEAAALHNSHLQQQFDKAKGRMRSKLPALREALEGRFSNHHALVVGEILAHIDYLDETIERLGLEIEKLIDPFSSKMELLRTIPGVDRRVAETLIGEIGADMSRFPSHKHLASWAGMCPGQNDRSCRARQITAEKGRCQPKSDHAEPGS